MIYTVQEVADKLHISKVTVYKKLKLTQFKDKAVTKQGQTMIDDDLLRLINNSLLVKIDLNIDDSETTADIEYEPLNPDNQATSSDALTAYKHLTDTLTKQLTEKDLQFNNQLSVKDLQINNLNERLKQSLELNRNSQVLLKDKPHEDILLLEEHFQQLDTKLEEVKENMQQRKTQQSKGLFSKLFKK